jgi:hypothetical protein
MYFKTFIQTKVYTRKNLCIKINFVHITITRNPDPFQIIIYRKPTNTEIITLENSFHPPEYKRAATRYFLNILQFFH